MAVKTAAYYTTRIEALHTQLESLEESAVAEYTTDNSGHRNAITYRKMEEIRVLITWYEKKLLRLSGGGRALAVFKSSG